MSNKMSSKTDTVGSNIIIPILFLYRNYLYKIPTGECIFFSRIFSLHYNIFIKLYAYLLYAVLQDTNI